MVGAFPIYITCNRGSQEGNLVNPIFTWYQSLLPTGLLKMAFQSSSASLAAFFPITFLPTNEKLSRANFPSWHAQVLSVLRGSRLATFIHPGAEAPSPFLAPEKGKEDSKEPPKPNPEFEEWVAKDQMVLNYLFSNMFKDILG